MSKKPSFRILHVAEERNRHAAIDGDRLGEFAHAAHIAVDVRDGVELPERTHTAPGCNRKDVHGRQPRSLELLVDQDPKDLALEAFAAERLEIGLHGLAAVRAGDGYLQVTLDFLEADVVVHLLAGSSVPVQAEGY